VRPAAGRPDFLPDLLDFRPEAEAEEKAAEAGRVAEGEAHRRAEAVAGRRLLGAVAEEAGSRRLRVEATEGRRRSGEDRSTEGRRRALADPRGVDRPRRLLRPGSRWPR